MNRRAFLGLLAAAPIAALMPWRPPPADVWPWLQVADVNYGSYGDYTAIVAWWQREIVACSGLPKSALELSEWQQRAVADPAFMRAVRVRQDELWDLIRQRTAPPSRSPSSIV